MVLGNYENYVKKFINEDSYSEEIKNEYEVMIKKFQEDYTPRKIESMSLEEYVHGKRESKGFFYTITKGTELVGRAADRQEFAGVYYDKNREEIIKSPRTHKYGKSVDEVFSTYKKKMVEIYYAAINEDNDKLNSIEFPHTIKFKMAAMYNPESYFTVFSTRHLQHFLVEMTQDESYKSNHNHIELMKKLLDEKNFFDLTDQFSNHKYSRLLYYLFGKVDESWNIQLEGEVKKDKGAKKISFFDDNFVIETDIRNNLIQATNKNKRYVENLKCSKRDYLKQQKENSIRGELAEQKVLIYEKEKLSKLGLSHKINEIKQISRENDAAGYDILSFNEDGTEKYIEVKSTISSEDSFFLSINELLFAENSDKREDYWVYFVKKTRDKYLVKEIHNPFLSDKKSLLNMQPVNYKIDLNFE